MDCPKCKSANREGSAFCGGCGASLAAEIACSSCGASNPKGNAFCNECGRPTGAPAPSDYTPAHLAEKILKERSQLQGERRTVTVLFADAVGSTPIGERLDAEDVYSLMQGCVQLMMDAVHRYEGHVVQFRGDGIMALFGAPIAHEDAARRAVVAGLEMQQALTTHAEEVRSRDGAWSEIALLFRVGVNTGPVVVGGIGDDLHMDFTAVGDTINLGARMESAATPGTVYITEATSKAVADFIECEPVGNLVVKGKAEPVSAYRAVCEKGVRTRFEAATSRGLTPYVGRSDELSVLHNYFERAAQGQGQVILVSGEAGIGKSRLLLELRKSLVDARWLEGHCISYGRGIPYLPVIDVVKRAFGVEEGDDDGHIIERVDAIAASWLPAAQKTVPYLKFLLSVDPGDPAVEEMDAVERRAGILDSLRALVLEEALPGTLVICVEDVHWADDQSADALDALLDVVRSAPILLVLTTRPGYQTRAEMPFAHRLVLGQLPPDESEQVALNVLAGASIPADLARLVLAKTEGNPFFIEEVTKSLVEGGDLRATDTGYELLRAVEDIAIPDSIQEVILSRIDRLEREAKQAIQLASVIGREFTVKLLERISDVHSELDTALAELKGLELIYEKSFFPELAYMFKHALTHDVAYSTLLVERRRLLHRVAATAIEELYADRLSEQLETLAHHYEQAEVLDKALDYLERSGDKASNSFANAESADFYARALDVCQRLGEQAAGRELAIAEKRGFVLFTTGDLAGSKKDFERMLDLARRLGDVRMEGSALGRVGLVDLIAHDFEPAEAALREALALAGEHDDVRYVSTLMLAMLCLIINRHDEARPLLVESRALSERVDDPFAAGFWGEVSIIVPHWQGNFAVALEQQAPSLVIEDGLTQSEAMSSLGAVWAEGLALGALGRYQESISTLERVIGKAERIGDVFYRIRALNSLGWVYIELQDLDRGWEWNTRALEVGRELGIEDPELDSNAQLNLGDILQARGRLDEAEKYYQEVEAIFRNPKPPERWMLWRYGQHMLHSYGELWLARGDSDKAITYANDCLELAERSQSRKNIVKGRRLRGQALLASGDLDEAQREIVAALGIAREIGNPPQLWRTLSALGDLHRARRSDAEAAAACAEAAGVIERVAASLEDAGLRETFLGSDAVRAIRAVAV